MKAIEISQFGAPQVLQLCERADPVAGAGEVLIAVTAFGINRPDVLQRMGHYPVPAGASDLPGLEVAGSIVGGDAAAMAAAGFKLGDRVCALVAGGGYAQLCVAPLGQCLPVPQGMTDVQAASLPETFFTVYSNVFDRAKLQAGETILIQGGSSGIGVTAIQMAKALGEGRTKVIVTAGSDEKCAACVALGADHAINYKTHDFEAEVKRIMGGAAGGGAAGGVLSNAPVAGVDVVLDMVAGSYVAKEIECLAEDGRLVFIGVQGGLKAEINAGLVLRRRLQITGSTLRPRSIAFKTQIAQDMQRRVWPLLASGKIKTVIHSVFDALTDAQAAVKAHTLMESNQHIGKIVLQWK
jgi:NADPH:quinone reductase